MSLKKITHSLRIHLTVAAALLITVATLNDTRAEAPSALAGGPKTIASKDRVSVLIDREIEDTKSFIILKISVPTDSKVNAFLLPDPPRLVVDFEGASIKKSENFSAPTNGVVKQVRLGAHADKLRVVVDLIKSTPPEYEWKAGKRQAIIKILEEERKAGPVAAVVPSVAAASTTAATNPPAQPAAQQPPAEASKAPVAATPTIAATNTIKAVAPTATIVPAATHTAIVTPTTTSTASTQPKLADLEKPAASGATGSIPAAAPNAGQGAPAKPALPDYQSEGAAQPDSAPERLGDLEASKGQAAKAATTFSIKGYRFEYLPDKTPVLKIALNKPRAQAQISKVDAETYKIEIKDCSLENEDLELPQFPPHDFVGFVMLVSEPVGKNVEISVSIENDMVLATSIHDNEIWVKKP
jgi:hypothetical protein